MNRSTKLGIIILAIGLSLLIGTVYRSTSTDMSGYMIPIGIKTNMWSSEANGAQQVLTPFFLPPRDVRLDVKTNSTINLYVLDSEGMRLWTGEGTLKSVWSSLNISQGVYNFHVNYRGTYSFIIFNPSNATATFNMNITLYGYEADLLWASIGFTAGGILFTAVSVLLSRKPKKQ